MTEIEERGYILCKVCHKLVFRKDVVERKCKDCRGKD